MSGQVLVLSTATRTVVRTIGAPNAWSTAVKPDGATLYVTEPRANRVQACAVGSGFLLAAIAVGTAPHDPTTTPDGRAVYVTNLGSNTTDRIDVPSNSVNRSLSG